MLARMVSISWPRDPPALSSQSAGITGMRKVGILAVFQILKERLSICHPFNVILAVDVSYMTFIMLRYIPCIPSYFRIFNHEDMLNFIKHFFSINQKPYELIIWFCPLFCWYDVSQWLICVCWTILASQGQILHPPPWSWWMVFLIYCWIMFASILLRMFASIFIRDIGL